MRATALLPALLLLLLSVAPGCDAAARNAPPRPVIPAAAAVARVRLQTVEQYDVTLTHESDIGALVDWLKEIDWSTSKGRDISNVGLAETGQIIVRTKDGATHTFGLSGESIIVDRWQWSADTERLAGIARQAGAANP